MGLANKIRQFGSGLAHRQARCDAENDAILACPTPDCLDEGLA